MATRRGVWRGRDEVRGRWVWLDLPPAYGSFTERSYGSKPLNASPPRSRCTSPQRGAIRFPFVSRPPTTSGNTSTGRVKDVKAGPRRLRALRSGADTPRDRVPAVPCREPGAVPLRRQGDVAKGFEQVSGMPYGQARNLTDDKGQLLVRHPLAYVDCHEPKMMALRVTRPGFLEGIKALKAKQGVPDYDPNRDTTRQEMRAGLSDLPHRTREGAREPRADHPGSAPRAAPAGGRGHDRAARKS
jgi:Cytochrome c552